MSREIKIALFAIITVAATIWGVKYLGGINMFSPTTDVLVEFPHLGDLSESAPVVINGFRVGTVSKIYQKDADLSNFIVVLTIDDGIKLPKSAIAQIYATGMTGGKQVRLMFKGTCTGNDCVQEGDYIKGELLGLLGSMVSPDEFGVYVDKLGTGVDGIIDSLKVQAADPNTQLAKTMRELDATVGNLRKVTSRVDGILLVSQKDIEQTTKYLESVMQNLQASNYRVTHILANVDSLTGHLADIDLGKTVGGVDEAVVQLRQTLTTTNAAIAEVGGLLNNLKSGQGTLGSLIASDSLYNNLNALTDQIGWLTQDLRLNPKRYTGIFKRKAAPYIYPGGDPALLYRDSTKGKN